MISQRQKIEKSQMKINLEIKKLAFDKSQYQACFPGSHVTKKYLGKKFMSVLPPLLVIHEFDDY